MHSISSLLAELVEAQTRQRGRIRLRCGRVLGEFFYNWSELTLAPVDWFRFGMVTQRTRVYQTGSDIQCGPLVGFSVKRIDLTTYVLYPDEGKPTVVLAVTLNF